MAQFNVNLAFNADTGKAKTQIMELQSLLSKIAYSGTTSPTAGLQSDIKAASEAAKELQFHLNNAFNTSTGNFDLSLLDRSLKTSGSNITDLSTKLLSAGQTGQQAFLKLAQSISMADQPMFRINNKIKELGVSIKNAARWQISSNIIHGLQGGIQSAYNYAQDLNKSLNNIRIVTGYDTDKMAEFAEQANKAAKALSTTTTEYTDASLIYFQQGLSDAEVQGRTDTTIKLANVTGQSVEETANQMTAIWNNFDDGSKSLEYYADVITALGAATASSSKEISEGLNKFSAVAESVGLSYEYASAALATVTATTRQSADIVGNAFKTLFARIQGLNLGETLDDGTTLNKYSEALFQVGIDIKDQSGQLKDMNVILDEMGSKWSTLDKDQQIALAQTVAGVRQYTQLVALMDNWDYFQQNLGVATGAEGTLQKQADIYAESWEAAEERVKAAAEGIFQSLLDDKFFIGINNGFANLLGGIGSFVKEMGGAKSLLLGFSSILISSFANKIPEAIQTTKYNLQLLSKDGMKNAYDKIQQDMNKATKQGYDLYKTSKGQAGFAENSSMALAIESANNLTAARNKLALVSDKMSTSEQQMANTQLSLIQQAQEEAIALKQKNEELQKSINLQQQNIINSNVGEKVSNKASLNMLDDTAKSMMAQNENDIYSNALENITKFAESFDIVKEKIAQKYNSLNEIISNSVFSNTSQQIEPIILSDLFGDDIMSGINDMIESIYNLDLAFVETDDTDIEIFNSIEDSIKTLNNLIPESIQEATDLKEIFSNLMSASKTRDSESIFKNIELLEKAFKAAKIEGKDFEKILKDLHGSSFERLTKDAKALEEQEGKLAEKTSMISKLLNEFNPQHIVSTSEAMGSLAGFMGNVVTVANSLKSIFSSWANPDLSGWEKISATLTGISMIIPTVLSGLRSYTTLISFLNTETAKEAALQALVNDQTLQSATMKGVLAAASMKATTAVTAENAALLAEAIAKKTGIAVTTVSATLEKVMADGKTKTAGAIILKTAAMLLENNLENQGNIARALHIVLLTIIKALTGDWASILKVVVGILAVIAGGAFIKWLSNLIVTQKEANKAISEANDKYEEQKEKLDELKDSLKATQERIEELQSQDSLSLVEQEELDKLLEQEASLQRQIALQEQLTLAAQKESAKTFQDNIDKASEWINNAPQKERHESFYDPFTGSFVDEGQYTPEEYMKKINELYTDKSGKILSGYEDIYQQHLNYYNNWVQEYDAAQAEWINNNKDSFNELMEGYENWYNLYGSKKGYEEQTLNYASLISTMNKAIYGEQYNDKVLGSMDKIFQVSSNIEDQNINQEIAKDLNDGTLELTSQDIANKFSTIFRNNLLKQGILPEDYAQHLLDEYSRAAEALKSTGITLEDLLGEEGFNINDLDILANIKFTGKEDLQAVLDLIDAYKNNTITVGFDLEGWKKDYSSKMNIIKDLETGDTISPEDYDALGDAYQEYFKEQLDGTYLLIGAAEELKAKVQEVETEILNEEIKQQQSKLVEGAKAYGEAVGRDNISVDYITKIANSFMASARGEVGAGSAESYINSPAYKGMMAATGITGEELNSYSTAEEKVQALAQAWLNLQNSLNENQNASALAAQSINELDQLLNDGIIDLEEYNNALKSVIKAEAEATDIDYTEVIEYAEALRKNNSALKDNIQLSEKIALAEKKQAKGADDLIDNYKDYAKVLKEASLNKTIKNTEQYSKTIKTLQKDLSLLTGYSEEIFTDEFINSDEIQKALLDVSNGVDGATERLKVLAAAQEIKIKAGIELEQTTLDNLYAEIANLNSQDIEIGATIDEAPALDSLVNLLQQAGWTTSQIQELFNNLGWQPNIEFEEVQVKDLSSHASGGYVEVVEGNPYEGYTVVSKPVSAFSQMDQEEYVRIPKIGSKSTGGGGYKKIDPIGNNSSKPPSGGGGGGGGSAPKHAEKKNDSDKERYHTLQNQLEDLKSEYDSISEAADRAFGKEKLKAIDDEINKTDELINKQEEYLDAIKANLPVDKAVMDAYYTDLIGGTIEYDERGNISNYDQIQDAMFAKYNKMTSLDEDSEQWQVFEKKYEQLEKYIEQYEETYDLLRDEEVEYQNLLRQRIDLQLEKVQYSIEIQLEIPENEIAIIEYQLGKIEDDAFKSVEAIGLLTKKAENIYDQIQVNKQGLNDLLELSLSTQEIIQLMNGDMSILEGKTFTEDQIDAIKEYRDNLLDLNEEFDDIRENIEEQVMEVFDAWNEKLKQGIDKLDHYGNVLESYKNIIDIVGKDTLGLSNAFMATLNQSSIDNAINKVTATKKSYEAMIDAQSQAEQALEEAKARNDEASIKMWEENLQSITEEGQSAREEMLSAWEDALDGIAEQFEATVERVVDIFNKEIYTLGGLEGLSEDFSRQQENADIMLDDYQKIYELSKLSRDINKSIDDIDSISGKQKLKKLLEQINKLQEDGVEMSQYDLEYMQKTYDLRMAEIELEEAQRAKNTVRLRKDNEGNWSYVYTQNMDAVDTAQQKYEDALYAMQDVSSNYIDEMSEKLISTSQEMEEALAAIRIQDYANIDDYYAEVQRVQKQYEDELAIQQKELQKAIDNNKILYDEDWTNYHNATGYKISDTQDFATTFRDTLLGNLMGSEEDTANFTDVISSAVNTLTQGLMQGAEVYYANLQNAMNAAGTSTDDFAKDFEEKIEEIEEKSEESTNKIKDLAKDMSSSLKDITDSVTTWQETYGEVMQQIINSNLDVINSFNDMLEALSIDENSITVKYDILSDNKKEPEQYASGGYTGKWGNYGKLAILDEKELILNKDDTVNFLDALGIAKQIIDTIDLNALQASYGFGNLVPATINENNSQTIEQDVHITAEFPNATNHNEIEQAFETLINKASQYANRK